MDDSLETLIVNMASQAPFAFAFIYILIRCRVSVDCGKDKDLPDESTASDNPDNP